jgi:hypothetical protein
MEGDGEVFSLWGEEEEKSRSEGKSLGFYSCGQGDCHQTVGSRNFRVMTLKQSRRRYLQLAIKL